MKITNNLLYRTGIGLAILFLGSSMLSFIKEANATIVSDYNMPTSVMKQQAKLSSELKSSYVKYASVSFITKKSSYTDASSGTEENPIKKINCPNGTANVNGLCIDVAACKSSFPLTSASNNVGSYITKDCGEGNRYCYTSCQTGWKKSGCECNAVDCSGFPLSTSGNNCDGVKSCKTGDNYKYKCTGCAAGYKLTNSGTCIEKKCSDYGSGYLTAPTVHCVKNDVKRNAESHCYKCTECEEGYELSVDFTCSAKQCETGYATGTTNVIAPCTNFVSQRAGSNICYSCTACSSEYYLKTGKCEACTWGDHTLTSCPTGCNCSNYRIDAACVFKYKITSAQAGYYVSGNSCPVNPCTGYGQTSAAISHCQAVASCQSGSTYKYKCVTPDLGYAVNATTGLPEPITCPTNQFNGYTYWCSNNWKCLTPETSTEACQTIQTCEELGYTKTDCGTIPALKCPFDSTKLFCGTNGNANGSTPLYTAGQIVYIDGQEIGMATANNLILLSNIQMAPYTGAVQFCAHNTTGGLSWRLPSMAELMPALGNTSYAGARYVFNKISGNNSPLWTTESAGGGGSNYLMAVVINKNSSATYTFMTANISSYQPAGVVCVADYE